MVRIEGGTDKAPCLASGAAKAYLHQYREVDRVLAVLKVFLRGRGSFSSLLSIGLRCNDLHVA